MRERFVTFIFHFVTYVKADWFERGRVRPINWKFFTLGITASIAKESTIGVVQGE